MLLAVHKFLCFCFLCFRQIPTTSLFFSGPLVWLLVASAGGQLGRRRCSFAGPEGSREGTSGMVVLVYGNRTPGVSIGVLIWRLCLIAGLYAPIPILPFPHAPALPY